MDESDKEKLIRVKIALGIGTLILLIGSYARFKGLLTFYIKPWATHAFNLDLIVFGGVVFLTSLYYFLKLNKYI